jgi:processing peptidase subunit alpha
MKEFYRPERMVLAGVGIDHEKLVDLGKKYFSVPKSDKKNIDEQNIKDNKAVWTGGVVTVMRLMILDLERCLALFLHYFLFILL